MEFKKGLRVWVHFDGHMFPGVALHQNRTGSWQVLCSRSLALALGAHEKKARVGTRLCCVSDLSVREEDGTTDADQFYQEGEYEVWT